MRDHVIAEITRMAAIDERIVLVTGDLGYNVLNHYQNAFPSRFVNVGISEQNMAAVAAGLALEGNLVFMYSIGNFPTLRCIEQIRNDICYHHANVKILSLGGGFAYGSLGMTHHATEDIAVMRAIPNMRVYAPADAIEAVACLIEACKSDEPAFIRMARGSEPNQHAQGKVVDVTKFIPIKPPGSDVNILTTGTILSEGIKLQKQLRESGRSVGLFSVPCIKPLDDGMVRRLVIASRLIVTMEDHNHIGGLGSAVAEVMADVRGNHAILLRAGLKDTFTEVVGSQDYLRDYYELSAEKVRNKIESSYRDIFR